MVHEGLSVVRGQAFLSSSKKKNIEVIIFPQAQWKMRAKGTDSGNRGNWLAQFKFTFLSIL